MKANFFETNVKVRSVNFFLTFIVIIVSGNLSIRVFDPSVVLVIRLVPNFLYGYIFIMYLLACMSLMFYIPVQLGVDLSGVLSSFSVFHETNYRTVIFFHNFHYDWQTMRNCGMFWEPGAFAGYIIIALLFSVWINKGKIVVSKVNVVLMITLVTTQSTTGVMAFLVLIVCHLYHSDKIKNPMMRLGLFPLAALLFLSMAYIGSGQVDFLGKKIQSQISDAETGDKWSQINRFGNIVFDMNYIADRPLTGWSANPETRFSMNSDLEELIGGMGNGLTGFVVRYGIPASLLCYYLFLTGIYRVTSSWAISCFSVFIVSMLLMGEIFLDFPVFLTLWFMTQKMIKSRGD